jgi:hypothetical protein
LFVCFLFFIYQWGLIPRMGTNPPLREEELVFCLFLSVS